VLQYQLNVISTQRRLRYKRHRGCLGQHLYSADTGQHQDYDVRRPIQSASNHRHPSTEHSQSYLLHFIHPFSILLTVRLNKFSAQCSSSLLYLLISLAHKMSSFHSVFSCGCLRNTIPAMETQLYSGLTLWTRCTRPRLCWINPYFQYSEINTNLHPVIPVSTLEHQRHWSLAHPWMNLRFIV